MRFPASPASALLLCAALGAASVGCGARLVPLRDQGAVLLATPTQEAEVRAAIARALAARGFTAEAEQPNKIVARLDSRGMTLRVSIDYSATQFAVSYIESQGYNFRVGPQGPMISSRYNQYAENLRRSISDELGRPAREAQALAVMAAPPVAMAAPPPVAMAAPPPVAMAAPPPVVAPPPPAQNCTGALLAAGHHASNLVHCNGVPDRCAVALLQAGHHPSNLVHCRGVEDTCAEQLLRSGQHPSNLVHCPR